MQRHGHSPAGHRRGGQWANDRLRDLMNINISYFLLTETVGLSHFANVCKDLLCCGQFHTHQRVPQTPVPHRPSIQDKHKICIKLVFLWNIQASASDALSNVKTYLHGSLAGCVQPKNKLPCVPYLVLVGLSVGYETWPPVGWLRAFGGTD